LVILGHQLYALGIKATMRRGDALVQEIEAYKTENGGYPTGISAEKFQKYKPTLKHSNF
jgi:hypothetical protein